MSAIVSADCKHGISIRTPHVNSKTGNDNAHPLNVFATRLYQATTLWFGQAARCLPPSHNSIAESETQTSHARPMSLDPLSQRFPSAGLMLSRSRSTILV